MSAPVLYCRMSDAPEIELPPLPQVEGKTHTIPRRVFNQICTLMMRDDPASLDADGRGTLEQWINEQAQALGFLDWIDAYHREGEAVEAEAALAPIVCFMDREVGLTMGDATVEQWPDGTWVATCPIGSMFGTEVEGECRGTGATRDDALASLEADRRRLYESMWV